MKSLKIYFLLCLLLLFNNCGSKKKAKSDIVPTYGDDRTQKVQTINDWCYRLTETTNDSTYGYTIENPIKVGKVSPENEHLFMKALLGPKGQKTTYWRRGSCCGFITKHGMIENMGLLDEYKLTWPNANDTLTLYLNMYDVGNLYIPKGLTAKK